MLCLFYAPLCFSMLGVDPKHMPPGLKRRLMVSFFGGSSSCCDVSLDTLLFFRLRQSSFRAFVLGVNVQ